MTNLQAVTPETLPDWSGWERWVWNSEPHRRSEAVVVEFLTQDRRALIGVRDYYTEVIELVEMLIEMQVFKAVEYPAPALVNTRRWVLREPQEIWNWETFPRAFRESLNTVLSSYGMAATPWHRPNVMAYRYGRRVRMLADKELGGSLAEGILIGEAGTCTGIDGLGYPYFTIRLDDDPGTHWPYTHTEFVFLEEASR